MTHASELQDEHRSSLTRIGERLQEAPFMRTKIVRIAHPDYVVSSPKFFAEQPEGSAAIMNSNQILRLNIPPGPPRCNAPAAVSSS